MFNGWVYIVRKVFQFFFACSAIRMGQGLGWLVVCLRSRRRQTHSEKFQRNYTPWMEWRAASASLGCCCWWLASARVEWNAPIDHHYRCWPALSTPGTDFNDDDDDESSLTTMVRWGIDTLLGEGAIDWDSGRVGLLYWVSGRYQVSQLSITKINGKYIGLIRDVMRLQSSLRLIVLYQRWFLVRKGKGWFYFVSL